MKTTKEKIVAKAAELRAKLKNLRHARQFVVKFFPPVTAVVYPRPAYAEKEPAKVIELFPQEKSLADGTELDGNCNWL